MAIGLYIHVPFCRQKCAYCDFYSLPAQAEAVERYLELLLTEAALRGKGQTVNTVFLGGGTPSLLSAHQISTVLEGVSRYFCLTKDVEITLEANPETLQPSSLASYRQLGINRLSMGVQTLSSQLLVLLGRRHTAQQALDAIDWAHAAGFDNVSCDLIYGIPGQSLADWQQDVRELVARGLAHLSLYCLEIYDATPLGQTIAEGRLEPLSEDLAADMYDWARVYLPQQGLEQYEISNFARPGRQCRHNLNYWQNGEYIGLGPAACSYLQGTRQCNGASLVAYEQALAVGQLPVEFCERLDELGTAAETVILALRLNAGVNREAFARRFGRDLEDVFGEEIGELLHKGWLEPTEQGYRLPWHMRPLANAVFASFLRDTNT